MKLRTYRSHLRRALHWYSEQLAQRHTGLLTPAQIEKMRQDLYVLQKQQQSKESNSVWWVPVGLHVEPERNYFEVVPTDESNVLYLDASDEEILNSTRNKDNES